MLKNHSVIWRRKTQNQFAPNDARNQLQLTDITHCFLFQSVDVKIQFYFRLQSTQSILNTNDNLHVLVFGRKKLNKKMLHFAFFLFLFVPFSSHYDRVEFEPSNLEFMQITSFCIQKRCVPSTHRTTNHTDFFA